MSLVSVSSLSCLLFRSFSFVPALVSHTLIHQGALWRPRSQDRSNARVCVEEARQSTNWKRGDGAVSGHHCVAACVAASPVCQCELPPECDMQTIVCMQGGATDCIYLPADYSRLQQSGLQCVVTKHMSTICSLQLAHALSQRRQAIQAIHRHQAQHSQLKWERGKGGEKKRARRTNEGKGAGGGTKCELVRDEKIARA